GDLSPEDLSGGRGSFANPGAASRAEIVKCRAGRPKRQNVRPREIDNMNVVANTCSIGRLVISAVNLDIRFLAQRNLEHIRDQMCLLPMIFTEIFSSARCIELTQ